MKKSTVLLLVIVLLFVGCSTAFARSAEDDYEKAQELLVQEKYADAAKAFLALGSYADAPRYNMYCNAILNGNQGNYLEAVQNLTSLDDFLDSSLLSVYYTALSLEASENYEDAAKLLLEISLYKDSTAHLLTYPEKINARDYAKAIAAQEANDLDTALALFKKLGNYKDSPDHVAALEEAIRLRDEAAALAANEAKYNQAVALEEAGDYTAAYDMFVALGSFKDSAARAESVEQKAQYQKGMRYIASGSYKDALPVFTSLAGYEDADEKAYALGISQFASMKKQTESSASFNFHDQYGLINFKNNHVTAPRFDSLDTLSDICYLVSLDEFYGLIDADGQELSPCKWYTISGLSDHTAVAVTQAKETSGWNTTYSYSFTLLGENGQPLTPVYAAIGSNIPSSSSWLSAYAPVFSDGLIRVKTQNGKWGFIDTEGNEKIQPAYSDACAFSNGLAAVQKDGKWGYIDTEGQFQIEPRFRDALDFNESGRAQVQSAAGWHVIDQQGQLVYFTSQPIVDSNAETNILQQIIDEYAAMEGVSPDTEEYEYLAMEIEYVYEEECYGDIEVLKLILGL